MGSESIIEAARRISKPLCIITVLTLLCACGNSGSNQNTDSNQNTTAHQPSLLSIQDTMTWILEPAADVIWDSAGFIITAEGEQDLTPTTDEGWNAVVHAAAFLSESGNLLALPGRSAGADWDEYAAGLSAAAGQALQAAHDRDSDALFKAGGRIYQVCRACHNQYWIRPGDS